MKVTLPPELEALRQDIQAGLNSGESVPLDMEAIKTEARKQYEKGQKEFCRKEPS